ncbi:sulfate transporter family protein [Bartonella sp. M0177]|uniref:sulfate transporter family protein n=1 Tax=Bartonella sp. M0177 TaxID=2750940 RepID=UPI0027153391|nr:sulfate transporter family protein [Bartonella sp. M0177]
MVLLARIIPLLCLAIPATIYARFSRLGGLARICCRHCLSVGLALLMALLIAPITSLIGGYFMDDAAEIIEKTDYPDDPLGVAMPLGRSLVISLKFLALSIVGNIIALILYFFPGVNLVAFYVINGYLLGREYFEFAACRHRTEPDSRRFYKQNAIYVFCGGVIIALFVSVPVLNLLTPLFAAAMMTYLHKSLSKKISQ